MCLVVIIIKVNCRLGSKTSCTEKLRIKMNCIYNKFQVRGFLVIIEKFTWQRRVYVKTVISQVNKNNRLNFDVLSKCFV
jgi:hypothetical protein